MIEPVKQYITIAKAEYDDLNKAANALMLIFNTQPIYLEQAVDAAKKAITGLPYTAEPLRAEISE